MSERKVFIAGAGIISPVGKGLAETAASLRAGSRPFAPLRLFPSPSLNPLPTGEVVAHFESPDFLPRTFSLAAEAAEQALAAFDGPPDAVLLGITTGGIASTEVALKNNIEDPAAYRYHGAGEVAEFLACKLGCPGPVLTVSTACSSGAAAIKIAADMIRLGMIDSALAGGADCLCRLTYYGFNSLQLIDPKGARPLDASRAGMTVAEAAGMVLLIGSENPPPGAIAQIAGGGLSCDAYHATAPHPEGEGALGAMRGALAEAGVEPGRVDYINLHGTGTIDNDSAEVKAVVKLFGEVPPAFSSIKGMTGHSLAAAGGVEAVVSAICIAENFAPANIGCEVPDPELPAAPILQTKEAPINLVLSNSFGFGGNNASLAIAAPDFTSVGEQTTGRSCLNIKRSALIGGAGGPEACLARLLAGGSIAGETPMAELEKALDPKLIRRLKKTPRMTLLLAQSVVESESVDSIYYGTGWGPLGETYSFIDRLFRTDEKLSSPTDFVGSVHNSPAGQTAMRYHATGANITTTGGDYSFEQAILSATVLGRSGEQMLLIGVDEHHPKLSPLFDGSFDPEAGGSDGGAAMLVEASATRRSPGFNFIFSGSALDPALAIERLAAAIKKENIETPAALLVGIPRAVDQMARRQLEMLCELFDPAPPLIEYRKLTGEHASAAAQAAALAIELKKNKIIPAELSGGEEIAIDNAPLLIIGLGTRITAIEVY